MKINFMHICKPAPHLYNLEIYSHVFINVKDIKDRKFNEYTINILCKIMLVVIAANKPICVKKAVYFSDVRTLLAQMTDFKLSFM